jgi:hypothetical protein
VLVTAGCPKSPSTDTRLTGAGSPSAASDALPHAARAGAAQARPSGWCRARGRGRETRSRDERDRRRRTLGSHFNAAARRSTTKETAFWAVEGPSARWYVVNADLVPVQDFCRSR